jgi:hypothetical protein
MDCWNIGSNGIPLLHRSIDPLLHRSITPTLHHSINPTLHYVSFRFASMTAPTIAANRRTEAISNGNK